jgi:sarcosine oxidase subunit delta
MLLIHCPYCKEDRPEIEFANAGEAHIARPADMSSITAEELEEYLYIRSNPRGLHFERWRHIRGCARFFNAVRHTVTDRFVMTYEAGKPKPSLQELEARLNEPGTGGSVK